MKIAIRYFSRGGNTKKLAQAIGEELGVEVLTTDSPLTEDVDILFLGSSVYAYGVDDNIKDFINGINVKVGTIYNFSTAALIKSTHAQISKLTKAKGLNLASEEYSCKGSFGPLHKGMPGENELRAVKEFAKKVAKNG